MKINILRILKNGDTYYKYEHGNMETSSGIELTEEGIENIQVEDGAEEDKDKDNKDKNKDDSDEKNDVNLKKSYNINSCIPY